MERTKGTASPELDSALEYKDPGAVDKAELEKFDAAQKAKADAEEADRQAEFNAKMETQRQADITALQTKHDAEIQRMKDEAKYRSETTALYEPRPTSDFIEFLEGVLRSEIEATKTMLGAARGNLSFPGQSTLVSLIELSIKLESVKAL